MLTAIDRRICQQIQAWSLARWVEVEGSDFTIKLASRIDCDFDLWDQEVIRQQKLNQLACLKALHSWPGDSIFSKGWFSTNCQIYASCWGHCAFDICKQRRLSLQNSISGFDTLFTWSRRQTVKLDREWLKQARNQMSTKSCIELYGDKEFSNSLLSIEYRRTFLWTLSFRWSRGNFSFCLVSFFFHPIKNTLININ